LNSVEIMVDDYHGVLMLQTPRMMPIFSVLAINPEAKVCDLEKNKLYHTVVSFTGHLLKNISLAQDPDKFSSD